MASNLLAIASNLLAMASNLDLRLLISVAGSLFAANIWGLICKHPKASTAWPNHCGLDHVPLTLICTPQPGLFSHLEETIGMGAEPKVLPNLREPAPDQGVCSWMKDT